MAKKSDRGGGEGTHDRGGVRSTMSAPWQNGSKEGSGNKMSAPFNEGSSGMATNVYQRGMPGQQAGPAPSSRDSLGTIKTDPHKRGR